MFTQIIKIDTKQLQQISKAFAQAPKKTTRIVEKYIDISLAILAKNTLKDDPVPYDHGNLLINFRKKKINAFSGKWWPTSTYATYVDQGTSKMKGRFYMEKILDKSQPQINKMTKKLGEKIAKQIIGK